MLKNSNTFKGTKAIGRDSLQSLWGLLQATSRYIIMKIWCHHSHSCNCKILNFINRRSIRKWWVLINECTNFWRKLTLISFEWKLVATQKYPKKRCLLFFLFYLEFLLHLCTFMFNSKKNCALLMKLKIFDFSTFLQTFMECWKLHTSHPGDSN